MRRDAPSADPIPGPPAYLEWGDVRWYRNARDGYYRNRAGFLLHHAVWAELHGPVPDGHEIHHRDHDRAHNAHRNLEAKPQGQHRSDHNRLRPPMPGPVASARARALWATREPRDVVCVNPECGVTFRSTGMRAKYHDRRCADAHRRALDRARLGL